MTSVCTETIRRIYSDDADDGACIEVRPYPEQPTLVQVVVPTDSGRRHHGAADLCLRANEAEALGRALLVAAWEARQAEQAGGNGPGRPQIGPLGDFSGADLSGKGSDGGSALEGRE